MVQQKEVQSLRRLAERWMEHAANPVMAQRRRQWKAVKDLKPEKPMILVETCMLPDYIGPGRACLRGPLCAQHRKVSVRDGPPRGRDR